MKRILSAFLAGGVILGASIGAAAGFSGGFSGGSVQSGSDTSLECTTGAVSVAYTVAWVTSAFEITGATVSGLTGCTGTAYIQLTDGGVAAAGTSSGSGAISGGSATISGLAASALDVDDVHVVVVS